jgi:hypothetical protein
MTLAYDWERILKRAHSLRYAALAFVFEGADMLLPIFIDEFPRHVFAGLSLLALVGVVWARLARQKDFYK